MPAGLRFRQSPAQATQPIALRPVGRGTSMNSSYPSLDKWVNYHARSDNFFRALSQESLRTFTKIRHPSWVPKGAVILMEGQPPTGLFALCEGQVKLSTTSQEGRTLILRIAGPGEVLGLHAVITGKSHEMTVETLQPSLLNFVNRAEFLRFIREHNDACLYAAQQAARNCQDAYNAVRSTLLLRSVPARVAKFLLESATDGHVKNGAVWLTLMLTHDDIAQFLGTTRESITRTLSDFRKKAIVEIQGSTLIIHDKPALECLVAA
jgi:CRP/FNR family cyclic AMP-dependent transcriptional regulator